MENRASGNWADRAEIVLLFAALFTAAFVLPIAFFGRGEWLELTLPGVPSLALAVAGIGFTVARPALAALLLLVAAPLVMALGLDHVSQPMGGESVGRELSLAVTGVAYFLGTARAIGGPAGRLPAGSAQLVLLPASLLLLALGISAATLADEAHYVTHHGEAALEARFLASSIALAVGSVTMLSLGPSLARAPRAQIRPPQRLVGRLILYFSLATVGLLLLDRLG
jgi:hypothetical protein